MRLAMTTLRYRPQVRKGAAHELVDSCDSKAGPLTSYFEVEWLRKIALAGPSPLELSDKVLC